MNDDDDASNVAVASTTAVDALVDAIDVVIVAFLAFDIYSSADSVAHDVAAVRMVFCVFVCVCAMYVCARVCVFVSVRFLSARARVRDETP
jgi:hypothetical protein